LNQEGTAAFNRLQRGTLRVNTAFNVDRFVVGGNVALSREQAFAGFRTMTSAKTTFWARIS